LSDLRLSLNVTAQDIAAPSFVKSTVSQVTQSGFAVDRLTLEITESDLVPNLKKAAHIFGKLREAGMRIAVDDFGTGYSNLLYLKSLPLDYLKLDHAMTRDISGQPRDRIIVRSMVALSRALGLEVIAEGVETDVQLAALHEEGCDYFQGFLKSPALDPADFEDFAMRSN
jgi:diguanylate cyclase